MLLTLPYWIEIGSTGRLAIMPRPRSGEWLEDEIAGWKGARIDTVLSLLEHDEIAELGLESEEMLCNRNEIAFLHFPISDRGVPISGSKFRTLVDDLLARVQTGQSIAIHCRAGIGRSSLVAACVMMGLGFSGDDSLWRISLARGIPVPDTETQRDWITAFDGDRDAAH